MPTSLHERAIVLPQEPLDAYTGWRRRVAGFVWRFLGPALQRQQEYNTAVAQTIDRTAHDLRRETAEQVSALADEVAKRWESMVAREQRMEQRYEARVGAQETATGELRTAVGTLQYLSQALKREIERLLAQEQGRPAGEQAPQAPLALDGYKYVGFEDAFRGSADRIRANLSGYVPLFDGASDVLDIGCGRGEFLQLLRDRGIGARGVDINREMVETCRRAGLDAVEGDALTYLESLPEASVGGVFAAQVVEHLEPDCLIRLLDLAFTRLRPGSRIVLETVNPACWAAFFESYIRDLTHVRPVHPDTLTYLLQATGFQQAEIRYSAPYPEDAKLQSMLVPVDNSQEFWAIQDIVTSFNAAVERLNGLLFTHLDYAAIATRT